MRSVLTAALIKYHRVKLGGINFKLKLFQYLIKLPITREKLVKEIKLIKVYMRIRLYKKEIKHTRMHHQQSTIL